MAPATYTKLTYPPGYGRQFDQRDPSPTIAAEGTYNEETLEVFRSRGVTIEPCDAEGNELTEEEQRQAQIFVAIAKVNEANDVDDFTGDGRPTTKALNAHLNFEISADERDKAFDAYQAGAEPQDEE